MTARKSKARMTNTKSNSSTIQIIKQYKQYQAKAITSDINCGKYKRGNWRAVVCSESGIQVRDLGSYRAPQYVQGTQSPLEDTLGHWALYCAALCEPTSLTSFPLLFDGIGAYH